MGKKTVSQGTGTDSPVDRWYGKSQSTLISLIIFQKLHMCMSHPSYEPSTKLASHRSMVALCGYHCAVCTSICEAVHDISWQRHPHIKQRLNWLHVVFLAGALRLKKE